MGHGFHAYHERFKAASGIASTAAAFYSASRTQTVMAPPGNDPISTEVGEYTKSRKTSGRYRRKSLARAYRLLTVNNQKVQLRFQGVNQWGTSGSYKLFNYRNSTNNQLTYPLYFFDLSSFYNTVNGVNSAAEPFQRLTSFGAAGTFDYFFDTIPGTGPDGTATSNAWQIENAPAINTGVRNAPLRSDIRKWVDVRMMLYGSTTQPTKFDISVVSFPDVEWNPLYLAYLNTLTQPVSITDQATMIAFMQWLLAQYTYNPIMVQNSNFASRIKFHKRWSCIVQPQETTETALTSGHMRQLNWFMKEDVICKYDWNDPNGTLGVTDPLTGDAFQQNLGQCQNNVAWSKRKYLMIRATSKYRLGAGAPTPDPVDPSFDLIVRTRHDVPA